MICCGTFALIVGLLIAVLFIPSTANMSQTIPLPRSKAHLLQLVENLSYNEKIAFASNVGTTHRGKPEVKALVDDLLKVCSTPRYTKLANAY